MIFELTLKGFNYPDLLNNYYPIINDNVNIKFLNLADIFDELRNFRNIAKIIIEIKNELDTNIVLMASGRLTPLVYPILIYLGVDLINASYLLFISSENYYVTTETLLPIYKMRFLPCSCAACRGDLQNLVDQKYSSEKSELLALHNIILAKNYMSKIKQFLATEDYRGFVEKTTLNDTYLISLLRVLDNVYYDSIKLETPLTQNNKKLNCLGQSSYNRPDFQVFRKRVLKKFNPEPWTKVIIVLPCSAKKPYSQSKSHKKFMERLRKYPEFPSFQEIILTSPLGAIPRQLEDIYPVNSYDISVTGDWDNDEIEISSNMLINLIQKYDEKIPIICHVAESGYSECIKKASQKVKNSFYFTKISDSITSSLSLKSLEDLVMEYKDVFNPINDFPIEKTLLTSVNRKVIKIIDFQ